MNMRSIFRSVPLFLCLALQVPQGLGAQSSGQFKNLQKSIVEMQMEMQEYQDELQEQFSGQRQLVEQAKIRVDEITEINRQLQVKVEELENRQRLNEEKILKLQKAGAETQFEELSGVISALILAQLGDSEGFEEKLLDLLNEGSNLPADQLISLLAESHKRRGALEESLGFYGLLISDHPSSFFLDRSIFEASELLGQLDQKDQQLALLESLSESEGDYAEKARGRLKSLSN